MIKIAFLLGRPRSGKSTAAGRIAKQVQSDGWTTVRFIDYGILPHLFQQEKNSLNNEPNNIILTRYGGFDVINFSVLDTEFRYKHDLLHKVYEDSYRQAHRSFNVALAALILGILLVMIGAILAFTMSLPIGILTSVSSTITEIVSVLAFKLSADSNKRLGGYAEELSAVELANRSMQYIECIANKQERDRAIADLVKDLRAKSS